MDNTFETTTTVYAVLNVNGYSLVNIHKTLDAAVSQVSRLQNETTSLVIHLSNMEEFSHASTSRFIVQPYSI